MKKTRKIDSIKSFGDLESDIATEWMTENSNGIDDMTLKNLFTTEDWVYICVDLISQEISNVPIKVMQKKTVDGKINFNYAENHPLQKVLNNPNKYQGSSAFLYCIGVEYTLMGNAIIWDDSNGNIYCLPTERVTLDFNKDNSIRCYKYNSSFNNGYINKAIIDLNTENILHIRRPNPTSILWGLSPFIPGNNAIKFNRYSNEYLLNFYQKGATPTVVLTMDVNASAETSTRMLRSFEQAYTGRKNQRRALLLPKGVSASSFQVSIADQKLIEIINMNREVVINLLRIPKHALSLATTGSLGSEEHKQALKYFWTATILPTLQKIEDGFNSFFAKQLENKYVIKFDTSDVSILKDDDLKKAQIASTMLSTHTINEIRSTLYNLPPLKASSKNLYDRISRQKAEYNLKEKTCLNETDNETQILLNDSDTSSLSCSCKAQINEDEIEKNLNFAQKLYKKFETKFTKQGDEIDSLYSDVKADFVKNMLKLFNKQLDESLAIVAKELKEYKPKKDLSTKKDPKVNYDDLEKKLNKAFDKLKKDYEDSVEGPLKQSVDVGYEQNFSFIFDKKNEDAIRALGVKNKDRRYAILSARNIDTFENISKTSTDKVINLIKDGVNNQQTLQDIAKIVTDNFRDISPSRALTIARTEVLTAVSIGQAAMMESAKEVIPDLIKVWINAQDARVRGNPAGDFDKSKFDHWEMQGKRAKVDELFEPVGLRYPRDVRGAAGNTINCRCSFLILSKEDIDSIDM